MPLAERTAGPLTEHIAASVEEVQALLDDNRSLSIAYLSRRIRDLEESVEARIKRLERMIVENAKRIDKAAEYVKKNVKGKP